MLTNRQKYTSLCNHESKTLPYRKSFSYVYAVYLTTNVQFVTVTVTATRVTRSAPPTIRLMVHSRVTRSAPPTIRPMVHSRVTRSAPPTIRLMVHSRVQQHQVGRQPNSHSESSKERKFQRARVPGCKSSRERKYLAPGSEWSWERKVYNL